MFRIEPIAVSSLLAFFRRRLLSFGVDFDSSFMSNLWLLLGLLQFPTDGMFFCSFIQDRGVAELVWRMSFPLSRVYRPVSEDYTMLAAQLTSDSLHITACESLVAQESPPK